MQVRPLHISILRELESRVMTVRRAPVLVRQFQKRRERCFVDVRARIPDCSFIRDDVIRGQNTGAHEFQRSFIGVVLKITESSLVRRAPFEKSDCLGKRERCHIAANFTTLYQSEANGSDDSKQSVAANGQRKQLLGFISTASLESFVGRGDFYPLRVADN